MSAIPPKAEVNSEHERLRYRPVRVDGAARAVIQAPKPEPRIMRYELSDYEWAAIKPMLPNKPRGVRHSAETKSQRPDLLQPVSVSRTQPG
jgi:hypothetical protein